MNKITKTVGFRINGVDRKGYLIHTPNAVYKAEPSGSQGYTMTGERYPTLKACKQALMTGGVVERVEPEIEPSHEVERVEPWIVRVRGLMEPPCNPVYLLAALIYPKVPTKMEREVLDCFGLIDPITGEIDVAYARSVVEAHEREFEREQEARGE